MSESPPELVITRCESCHARFLPRPGPCPRCGATTVAVERIPPVGQVLASTEAAYPPAGWSTPHRLALVSASEDIRILALVEGELPRTGDLVGIERRSDHYVVRRAAASGTPSGPAGP